MSYGNSTGFTTPVRRLGLSRKVGSPCLRASPSLCKTPTAKPAKREISELVNQEDQTCLTPSKLQKALRTVIESDGNSPLSDRQVYFNSLTKKLSSLEKVDDIIEDLEIWQNGCKESLLDLQSWLSSEEDIKLSCSELSKKLGIWSVVHQNFKSDPDIVSEED